MKQEVLRKLDSLRQAIEYGNISDMDLQRIANSLDSSMSYAGINNNSYGATDLFSDVQSNNQSDYGNNYNNQNGYGYSQPGSQSNYGYDNGYNNQSNYGYDNGYNNQPNYSNGYNNGYDNAYGYASTYGGSPYDRDYTPHDGAYNPAYEGGSVTPMKEPCYTNTPRPNSIDKYAPEGTRFIVNGCIVENKMIPLTELQKIEEEGTYDPNAAPSMSSKICPVLVGVEDPNMTVLNIPEGVELCECHIADVAPNVVSATIPRSFKGAVSRMFNKHPSLTKVDIYFGIKSIGMCMFNACTNLEYVTIPATVTNFESFSFNDCTRLRRIEYQGNPEKIKVDSYAFEGVAPDVVVDYVNYPQYNSRRYMLLNPGIDQCEQIGFM